MLSLPQPLRASKQLLEAIVILSVAVARSTRRTHKADFERGTAARLRATAAATTARRDE